MDILSESPTFHNFNKRTLDPLENEKVIKVPKIEGSMNGIDNFTSTLKNLDVPHKEVIASNDTRSEPIEDLKLEVTEHDCYTDELKNNPLTVNVDCTSQSAESNLTSWDSIMFEMVNLQKAIVLHRAREKVNLHIQRNICDREAVEKLIGGNTGGHLVAVVDNNKIFQVTANSDSITNICPSFPIVFDATLKSKGTCLSIKMKIISADFLFKKASKELTMTFVCGIFE